MDSFPWLLVAPLLLIQLGLMIFALRDLLQRRPPYWIVWLFVVILISIIGPVLYLLLVRRENDGSGNPNR
jgi:drug/metabolite transporter (DMT)-like permease